MCPGVTFLCPRVTFLCPGGTGTILSVGALEPDGMGLLAAMVKDTDKITGAAVVDGAADGSGTDRRFSSRRKPRRVSRRSRQGYSILVAHGRRSVSPEARNNASPSKDEVRGSAAASVIDPLIFDPSHGDWWPVELGAPEESWLGGRRTAGSWGCWLGGSGTAGLVGRERDGWMVVLLVGRELDGWMMGVTAG